MIGPAWDKAKSWSSMTLIVLLAISAVLSIVNSKAIHAVSITVIDAANEVRDKRVPGMSKESALPDYRIEVMRRSDGRVNLGTQVNTSAVEKLTWQIQDPIPLVQVTSIRVVDDDKLANDVIEEVQIEGETFSSKKYHYELDISRTAGAAFSYFFTTPIGTTILIAIGLAIFVYVASKLPW